MTTFFQLMRPDREIRVVFPMLLSLVLAVALFGDEEEPEFLRFVRTGDREGHVDTAIVSYRMEDGQQVDLVSVIHIADRDYYRKLNQRFRSYDAVLYEMVKPPEVSGRRRPTKPPSRAEEGRMASYRLLGGMQQGMKSILELEFQTDVVDYARPNFVHADMDSLTFARRQKQKGESLFSLMLRSAIEDYKLQLAGKKRAPGLGDLLSIVFSEESRAHSIKWIIAQEMNHLEEMLAGVDGGGDGEGSVILSERNRVAMRVLDEQLAEGKKRIAIFYGAGHMPDLEKRILSRGGERTGREWFTAWDLRKEASAR